MVAEAGGFRTSGWGNRAAWPRLLRATAGADGVLDPARLDSSLASSYLLIRAATLAGALVAVALHLGAARRPVIAVAAGVVAAGESAWFARRALARETLRDSVAVWCEVGAASAVLFLAAFGLGELMWPFTTGTYVYPVTIGVAMACGASPQGIAAVGVLGAAFALVQADAVSASVPWRTEYVGGVLLIFVNFVAVVVGIRAVRRTGAEASHARAALVLAVKEVAEDEERSAVEAERARNQRIVQRHASGALRWIARRSGDGIRVVAMQAAARLRPHLVDQDDGATPLRDVLHDAAESLAGSGVNAVVVADDPRCVVEEAVLSRLGAAVRAGVAGLDTAVVSNVTLRAARSGESVVLTVRTDGPPDGPAWLGGGDVARELTGLGGGVSVDVRRRRSGGRVLVMSVPAAAADGNGVGGSPLVAAGRGPRRHVEHRPASSDAAEGPEPPVSFRRGSEADRFERALGVVVAATRLATLLWAAAVMAVGWSAYTSRPLVVGAYAVALLSSVLILARGLRSGRMDAVAGFLDLGVLCILFAMEAFAVPGGEVRALKLGWVGVYGLCVCVDLAVSFRFRAGVVAAGVAAVASMLAQVPGGGSWAAATAVVGPALVSHVVYFGGIGLISRTGRRMAAVADESHAEMRAYALELARMRGNRARAAERARFRRFLHDEVIQTLEMLAGGFVGDPESAARLAGAPLLRVGEAPPRERDGLKDGLWAVAREFPMLDVHLEIASDAGESRADPDVHDALMGAVRASLANVVRHSGTRDADVWVRDVGGSLLVTVADQGKGFDTTRVPEGFGVTQSLRARIRELGGEVDVVSVPGGGTVVSMRVRTHGPD